jgi:hypothetical protein
MGIEEGKPERVPLLVRLYAETSAYKDYVKETNHLFARFFRPADGQDVVVGEDASRYETLRDFCYLQSDMPVFRGPKIVT